MQKSSHLRRGAHLKRPAGTADRKGYASFVTPEMRNGTQVVPLDWLSMSYIECISQRT
jgi:hypothetical protein